MKYLRLYDLKNEKVTIIPYPKHPLSNPNKKGGRAYVNIAEHTNTYHTKFYFNINYFINALLQNRLHSNFR